MVASAFSAISGNSPQKPDVVHCMAVAFPEELDVKLIPVTVMHFHKVAVFCRGQIDMSLSLYSMGTRNSFTSIKCTLK